MIDQDFQGINSIFVLLFEDAAHRSRHTRCFLPKVNSEHYIFRTDGRNFFGQPIRDDMKIGENIFKNAIGQGDDYTAGCLLDCPYFNENYNMIAIDLSIHHVRDVDPKAIQRINFIASLDRVGQTFMLFIFYGQTNFNFLTRNCKNIRKHFINLFCFYTISAENENNNNNNNNNDNDNNNNNNNNNNNKNHI